MSLEILIAGIAHETNSYCRELTRADAFYTRRGDEVLRARQTSTDDSYITFAIMHPGFPFLCRYTAAALAARVS